MTKMEERWEKAATAFALAHRKDKGSLKDGRRISRARELLRRISRRLAEVWN